VKIGNLNRFWLGGNIFGYSAHEDTVFKILDKSEKMGIGGVDTSSSYSKGQSEIIIGRWLNQEEVRRKHFMISTKIGLDSHESPNGLGHPDRILETLHSSLQRLQTDYVDVLFLHAPDPTTDIFLTIQTFHELHQKGLIRGFGICNASISDVENYLTVINKLGMSVENFYIQNYFNWARRKSNYWVDFLELNRVRELNSFSYGLLARGVFMSKSDEDEENSRKNKNFNILAESLDQSLKKKFELVERICKSKGQTLYSYSLAYGYYLSKYSIIGIRTMAQLDELIKTVDSLMSQRDFKEIQNQIQELHLDFSNRLGDPLTNS
jgi:aryl-alcohol dehydrogenase-like predicted oxidoreductase